MTLKSLLKQHEAQIKEAESFFDESFSGLKEFNIHNKAAPPKPPEIAEVHITSHKFPLNLHLGENIRNFLRSGVLRPLEHYKSKEFYDDLFKTKVIEKMVEKFFILVFLVKFPEENSDVDFEAIKEKLGKNINRYYSEIFVRSPKPNNDLLNAITFSIGYIVHMIYFQTFPLNRASFSLRFIFDVYHIIIFHLNGLFVSDFYLQTLFERIFTSKFLDYELIRIPQKDESDINPTNEQSSLVATTRPNVPNTNSEYKYQDFAGELSNRLKVKQKLLRRRDSEKSMSSIYAQSRRSHVSIPSEQPPSKDDLSERMRFNCSQISPSISSILNAPILPHTKTKTLNYSLEKSYLNKTQAFIQLYECFQRKLLHETKKPSKSLPKISSFHSGNENFLSENVRIDSLQKASKLHKHMKDLSVTLKKQEQRYSSLNSAKKVFEYTKRKSKQEKNSEQQPQELPNPPSDPNPVLKPPKLGQLNDKFNKSMRFILEASPDLLMRIKEGKSPFLGQLLKPGNSPSERLKSPTLNKAQSRSGAKLVSEKELKPVHDKLNAKVYEKGETIDINEGLKNKVKTFIMLNDDLDDGKALEVKAKKREYINKYAKLINENIDENIKGINRKLDQLNKKGKVNSLHY